MLGRLITARVGNFGYREGFVHKQGLCIGNSCSGDVIGKAVLAGHNNFVLISDEAIIGGLRKNGVDLADARAYVNGGCQETMIEGCGHTEGAAVYISMAHILDAFLRQKPNMELVKPVERAETFADFYAQFVSAVKRFINVIFTQRNIREYYYKNGLHCPLIPAHNMEPWHIAGIIGTARSLTHLAEIHLEPYHNLGISKREGLGKKADKIRIPERESILQISEQIAAATGLSVTVL